MTVSDRILTTCSRVTSGGALIPELDGMRFFAILSVVLFHCNGSMPSRSGMVNSVLGRGWFGVELFFVISGFVLAYPFAKHYFEGAPRVSLARYFLRRVTRLEPPYILSLLVYFAAMVFIFREPASSLVGHLLVSLGYSHHLFYPGTLPVVNSALWSLEIEVQWYLAAPLVCTIYRVRSKWVRRCALIGLATLLTVILRAVKTFVTDDSLPVPAIGLVLFGGLFLAGVLLADIFVTEWKHAPVRHWKWDVVTVTAVAALYPFVDRFHPLWQYWIGTVYPALLCVVYIGVFRSRVVNSICRNRWLVTIGGMCYTLYLYHVLIMQLLLRYTPVGSLASEQATLCIVSCQLVLGAALFVLTEKPFMRRDWHRALIRRLRTMATPR